MAFTKLKLTTFGQTIEPSATRGKASSSPVLQSATVCWVTVL